MSHSKQVSCYDQSPDVALEFFRIMSPKKETPSTKSVVNRAKLSSDVMRGADSNGTFDTPGIEVLEGPAVLAPEAEEQTAAQIIAQRLREMGDQLDQRISEDIRQKFQEEFKNQSVFNLAYNNFSRLCIRSLIAVQRQMRSGWDQVYFLYFGYTQVAMEIVRQAGSSADGRIQILANYLRDIMREIALEDWVERQGGLQAFNPENMVSGDIVQISMPPEGSSVDN